MSKSSHYHTQTIPASVIHSFIPLWRSRMLFMRSQSDSQRSSSKTEPRSHTSLSSPSDTNPHQVKILLYMVWKRRSNLRANWWSWRAAPISILSTFRMAMQRRSLSWQSGSLSVTLLYHLSLTMSVFFFSFLLAVAIEINAAQAGGLRREVDYPVYLHHSMRSRYPHCEFSSDLVS